MFWSSGKFRHLPVVENGEVIALLDITKCLYDAISRMEKAAEQGSAIAAAVEGVERQWGNNFTGQWLLLFLFFLALPLSTGYGTACLILIHACIQFLLLTLFL